MLLVRISLSLKPLMRLGGGLIYRTNVHRLCFSSTIHHYAFGMFFLDIPILIYLKNFNSNGVGHSFRILELEADFD